MKVTKNWRAYCQTTFNSLQANIDNWGKPDFFRPITRIYYIGVFDCGQVNHLGLISEAAKNNPNDIQPAIDSLNKLWSDASTKMYQATSSPQEPVTEQTEQTSDVEDAEFTVVE